jgi:hypothetical protein
MQGRLVKWWVFQFSVEWAVISLSSYYAKMLVH